MKKDPEIENLIEKMAETILAMKQLKCLVSQVTQKGSLRKTKWETIRSGVEDILVSDIDVITSLIYENRSQNIDDWYARNGHVLSTRNEQVESLQRKDY